MPSKSFVKIYKYLCITTLFLIALGGSVRAMNAGLACPDWPLCFGDFIPDYHPQVYFEFLHRVLAGMVAIAVFILNTMLLRKPQVERLVKGLCISSFVILIVQIVMGGLTVLLLLQEKIVTTHLTLGVSLLAVLSWIYFSISVKSEVREDLKNTVPVWLHRLCWFTLATVGGQIILGGLVASHHASLACTEFPLCYGKFIPTLSGQIGLHVIHRLGAYFTFLVTLGLTLLVFKNNIFALKRLSIWMMAIVVLQIVIGISNVLFHIPPVIVVAHLATGAILFIFVLRMVFVAGLAQREASPNPVENQSATLAELS